jgi:hypothetical protein
MRDPKTTRGAFGRMTSATAGPGLTMTNLAREVVVKYLIIGRLPIVEKATVVPLLGIFHGTLIGLFMTPIFQHGIDMTVVFTEGNAIFLHYHLIHLTAPAPVPPPPLHTEESTDYPHVALQW